MPDPNDLNAFFQQVVQAQGELTKLFGENLPGEMAAQIQRFQQDLPNIQAQTEAALAKAKAAEAELDNYLKRLQGEEVESDKEKEGDLDTVPDRFEAEHGYKSQEINGLVQDLRQLVEPEQPKAPTARGWR